MAKCDRCEADLDAIVDPAVKGHGYESQTAKTVKHPAEPQRSAEERDTLCADCYRKDFAVAHPGVACPV
jgi:hypothetical protein